MVEFVLTAPLLFFMFFALIQGTALAWTCLSVQRAAQAAVRHASRVERNPSAWDSPRLQALVALTPLIRLNKACLVSGFFTQVVVTRVENHLIATVRYPMPLWVPLVGPILGERLLIPSNGITGDTLQMLQTAFQVVGQKPPDLSAPFRHLPYYRWITFQAEAPIEPPALPDDR